MTHNYLFMIMLPLYIALFYIWLAPSTSYRPVKVGTAQNKFISSLKNEAVRIRSKTSLQNGEGNEQQSGMKGLYRRPSKAVEQGGGFFIPGLEDGKIRVLSGVVLISLVAINHNGESSFALAQTVSELTSITCALYLLLQGVLPATTKSTGADSGSHMFLTNLQAARSTTRTTTSSPPTLSSPVEGLNPTTAEVVARLVSRTTAGVFYVLAARRGDSSNEVITELGPVSSDSVRRWSEALASSDSTLSSLLLAADEVAKLPVGSDSAAEMDVSAFRSALATRGGPNLPDEAANIAYVIDPRGYRWLIFSKQGIDGLKFIGRVCRL